MADSSGTPVNPFSPRQIRILKLSIGVMTLLIILGVGALIFGMLRQASRITTKPPSSSLELTAAYSKQLQLGSGEVKSIFATETLIIIAWKGETGDAIVTLDPRTGQEIGRILIPRP